MNARPMVAPTDYYELLRGQRPTTRYAPSSDLFERLADAIGVPLEPALEVMKERRRELQDMLLTSVPRDYKPLHAVGRPPWVHIELRNRGYVIRVWAGSGTPRELARIVGHNPFLGQVHRVGRMLGSQAMYPHELLNKTGEQLKVYEELTASMAPNMEGVPAEEAVAVIMATAAAISA